MNLDLDKEKIAHGKAHSPASRVSVDRAQLRDADDWATITDTFSTPPPWGFAYVDLPAGDPWSCM